MAELPTGTITLLFTDIEGSTRLLQRAGDAYAGLLAEHRRLLGDAFCRHGGIVVDSEGDAFFVAFASARDAVAGAADAQRTLAAHEWPDEHEIRVRMGLHTGEHRLKDLSRPQRLYQRELEGLPGDFPPLKTLDNRPTNLPVQPNELIGRERELAEAAALLSDGYRVVTLTGTGGTGKTRLALQLAADVVEEFPNGVFFVSLAPVRDWELVAPTIAGTLGL